MRAAARTASRRARSHCLLQERQCSACKRTFDVGRQLLEPRGRAHQFVVAAAAFAVLTLAMRTDGQPERVRTQVGDAAEKIDRRFGIAVLELPIRRAHAAHLLQLAGGAFGRPRHLPAAHAAKKSFPALPQRSGPEIELVLVREIADAHAAVGIDRERREAATALIEIAAALKRLRWPVGLVRYNLPLV